MKRAYATGIAFRADGPSAKLAANLTSIGEPVEGEEIGVMGKL